MIKLALVLLVALVLSSMHLVRVSYDERRLYAERDKAQQAQKRLEAEWGRLKAQAQAQATPLRVERVAREKLGMAAANPAATAFVLGPVASQPGGAP
jgi:cell division protein FtsL